MTSPMDFNEWREYGRRHGYWEQFIDNALSQPTSSSRVGASVSASAVGDVNPSGSKPKSEQQPTSNSQEQLEQPVQKLWRWGGSDFEGFEAYVADLITQARRQGAIEALESIRHPIKQLTDVAVDKLIDEAELEAKEEGQSK